LLIVFSYAKDEYRKVRTKLMQSEKNKLVTKVLF